MEDDGNSPEYAFQLGTGTIAVGGTMAALAVRGEGNTYIVMKENEVVAEVAARGEDEILKIHLTKAHLIFERENDAGRYVDVASLQADVVWKKIDCAVYVSSP
jgi:hypothetical protein